CPRREFRQQQHDGEELKLPSLKSQLIGVAACGRPPLFQNPPQTCPLKRPHSKIPRNGRKAPVPPAQRLPIPANHPVQDQHPPRNGQSLNPLQPTSSHE